MNDVHSAWDLISLVIPIECSEEVTEISLIDWPIYGKDVYRTRGLHDVYSNYKGPLTEQDRVDQKIRNQKPLTDALLHGFEPWLYSEEIRKHWRKGWLGMSEWKSYKVGIWQLKRRVRLIEGEAYGGTARSHPAWTPSDCIRVMEK